MGRNYESSRRVKGKGKERDREREREREREKVNDYLSSARLMHFLEKEIVRNVNY